METSKLFNVAEINLVYKPSPGIYARPLVKSSREAHEVLFQSWDKTKMEFVEQFKVLLLNRASHVIGIYELSTGGTASTIVDVKLTMVAALKANASSIVLAHNHPSGNMKPSDADLSLTSKLANAGKLLDITVVDHIVLTANGYFSFADEGLM